MNCNNKYVEIGVLIAKIDKETKKSL